MIFSKHTLSYCAGCQTDMVVCVTCGNNSCNSCYGDINGQQCRDCPEAYEHQDTYWKNNDSVRFAKDIRQAKRL